MLRQKTFVKVTGRGSVTKVVKEHYLREDIPCGVLGCQQCVSLTGESGVNIFDPTEPTLPNSHMTTPHIILPDTNILLHHLDVLETDFFHNVVILQTVLEEVKGNSLAIHRRIRSLIAQPAKRFFVFSNEHHKETFIEKLEGESENDRNDRSIRKSAAWYMRHLQTNNLPYGVVLLTNDAENRRLAQSSGIFAMRLVQYCEGFTGAKDLEALMDMLESAKDSFEDSTNILKEQFVEYLSVEQLQVGIENGVFFKGTMQVSPYNKQNGSITIEGKTIRVIGVKNMNRALQGDFVVIELLPREQWLVTQTIDTGEDEGREEKGKDTLDYKKTTESELISFPAIESVPESAILTIADISPAGKVVGVLKRSLRSYCGSIDRKTIKEHGGAQNVLVQPLDRRVPRIRIRTRNAQGLSTQRILVSIDGWERNSCYPHGHLVRIIGQAGDKSTETEVILLEHDVAYTDFTPQVLACLPSAEWIPSLEDYAERVDFRDYVICSVDPPGCTDIDDALHARPLNNGHYEVGVHIADVTHFVKATTPLDLEASQRSTTIYLVDRRIDMLPGLLGTNLCSLKSNVERLSFSCVWEITPTAEVVSTRFCKSIIKSRASFTYDEAQKLLENPAVDDPLSSSLKILNMLAKQLKIKRIEAGALTLASPEVRFTLETETQNPVDVVLKDMKDANSMVEEFMLLANVSVANKIYSSFPETAVLRRHPSPPVENFVALNKALTRRNFHIEATTSKALAESLDRIHLPEDPFFNRLVRIMTTRCMYQAQYFAAGTHSYDAFWHYGLATPIYTHFTSPIRRYADVIVHRLLAAAIDPVRYAGTSIAFDKQRLEEICANMNYRHRMAQQAQRSSIELYTHLFFRGKTVLEDAYIIKIMDNGIVTLIPKYGIEGLVKWTSDELKESDLVHDAEEGVFRKDGQVVMALFQKITIAITVEEAESSQRQKLVINLVDPPLRPISPGLKRGLAL